MHAGRSQQENAHLDVAPPPLSCSSNEEMMQEAALQGKASKSWF